MAHDLAYVLKHLLLPATKATSKCWKFHNTLGMLKYYCGNTLQFKMILTKNWLILGHRQQIYSHPFLQLYETLSSKNLAENAYI